MGLLDIFSGKRATVPREVAEFIQELDQKCRRLEIETRSLRDELSQLQGHHLKLRKQFDGSKGGRPIEDIQRVPFGDKAALRRALGVAHAAPASREADAIRNLRIEEA
jgi:hypothetical protein